MRENTMLIDNEDRLFLDRLRGISIVRVVLAHLGLTWFFLPYSSVFSVFLPVLFFVSGAVSYGSFLRSSSRAHYFKKRLNTLVTPYYFLIIISFLFIWSVNRHIPPIDATQIFYWITIKPQSSSMPYPLGQVWFIHALAVIILLSPVVFKLLNKNKNYFYAIFGMSIILSICQLYFNFHKFFIFYGHTFYPALFSLSFFAFGAYLFSFERLQRIKISMVFFSVFLIITFLFISSKVVDPNFMKHSPPNFYYLSGAFAAITFLVLIGDLINKICNKLKSLDLFILFSSKNAYSIFLLHSLSIFLTEKYFGLMNVARDPLSAITKILLVFIITYLLALPLSWSTKKVSSFILGKA